MKRVILTTLFFLSLSSAVAAEVVEIKHLGIAPWLGRYETNTELAAKFAPERANLARYVQFDLTKVGADVNADQVRVLLDSMESGIVSVKETTYLDGKEFLSMGWKDKKGVIQRTPKNVLKRGRPTKGIILVGELGEYMVSYFFPKECGNPMLDKIEKGVPPKAEAVPPAPIPSAAQAPAPAPAQATIQKAGEGTPMLSGGHVVVNLPPPPAAPAPSPPVVMVQQPPQVVVVQSAPYGYGVYTPTAYGYGYGYSYPAGYSYGYGGYSYYTGGDMALGVIGGALIGGLAGYFISDRHRGYNYNATVVNDYRSYTAPAYGGYGRPVVRTGGYGGGWGSGRFRR